MKRRIILLMGLICVLLISCDKDDDNSQEKVPVISTTEVIDITTNTSTSGGNVTSDGGAAITARGVCWSTTENPTIDDNKTNDGTGTGSFTSSVTGLKPNTTYYLRAYATNSEGTAYGNTLIFETLFNTVPVISTTEVIDITTNTSTSGGNVTSDGGAAITARGVCWSTTENPTIDDNKTNDGTGTGSFTSSVTGLKPNTTYYLRAYATNSEGTSYGNELSFTTLIPDGTTGTLEYNGYTYKTVYINGKEWLAENLRNTTYNDGEAIPNVTDDTAWGDLSTGAYCWYNNDETANKNTYGALYNWYAVNTGKLAPKGWHVPTDAEWTELTDYLGVTAGGKLKETGTTHWSSPNTGATNETGFTALPGGSSSYYHSFNYIGFYGCWWSSTETSTDNACSRQLRYNSSFIYKYFDFKESGLSVRCVRD